MGIHYSIISIDPHEGKISEPRLVEWFSSSGSMHLYVSNVRDLFANKIKIPVMKIT